MQTIFTDHNGTEVRSAQKDAMENDVDGVIYFAVSNDGKVDAELDWSSVIAFQNGAPMIHGVNGWTNEHLLAVLIDRTEKLDAKFGCPENKEALEHMRAALDLFCKRTNGRIDRGVEGKEVE